MQSTNTPLASNIPDTLNLCTSISSNNINGLNDYNGLSIFYYNCSGMRTKSRSFYLGILESDYDIIVLNETWLTISFNTAEFFPSDYCVFRRDRYTFATDRRGGGVLIAVRKKFCCELAYCDPTLDFISVKLKLNEYHLLISVVYLPCNSNTSLCRNFVDSISCKLIPLMNHRSDFVIFGDFNFPDVIWLMDENVFIPTNTNDSSAIICDYMADLGASQINTIPNSRGTFLDLIFYTNNRSFKLHSCEDFAGYSSIFHTPITIEYALQDLGNLNFNKNCIKYNYSKADYISINSFLAGVDWKSTLSSVDINCSVDIFNELLKNAIEKFVPKIEMKKSYSHKDPWFTKELKQLEVLRNKAHMKFKQTESSVACTQFKFLRKQFSCLNRFLYNNYIIDIEDNLRCNPKKFWQYIKLKNHNNGLPALMEFNGQKSNDTNIICKFFSDYFKSVFEKDSTHIHQSSLSNNQNIVFCEQDVMKALLNLDVTKGPGPDDLPVSLLKHCAVGLTSPLCLLFNMSLRHGIFPDLWKISNIIPIYKSGLRNIVSNYRGIAILSCIPKLFESMVKEVMFFHSKHFLNERQHGFLPGRSTVTNLAVFQNNLIESIISKVQVDVVYTDFAKAFDKVNHRLLIHKLSEINCNFIPLDWLKSYLSNRKMYVKIDDTYSKCFVASSGVPQGSHLGPLLFILFINDVVDCFEYANCLLFADDMKIFANISSSLDRDIFQRDLSKFCNWCSTNLLFLNVDKCQLITYTKSRLPVSFDYFLQGHILKRVNVVNDLGVIFSSDLTFNHHIDAIINKAYSMLGFIKRNSQDFHDTLTFKSLYTSIVRSQIEYASVIWSPFYESHSNRIESIQKQFLLFVLKKLPSLERNDYKLSPYFDRCVFLGLQTLASRRKSASATFARDLVCGKLDCAELLGRLNIYAPQRNLRQREFFQTPTMGNNYSSHNAILRIQRDFNAVAEYFDFNISRDSFKRAIAKQLL